MDDLTEGDDLKAHMVKQGWMFGVGVSLDGSRQDPPVDEAGNVITQPHEWLGKSVRRFFKGHGSSDGKIVAWLPANEQSTEPALWHMVHKDGDEEDLEADEVQTALDTFARDLQEPEGGEDEDEENDEDEEEEVEDEETGLHDTEEEEEDEDEDEDEDADSSNKRLWPSWGAREKWKTAVSDAHTVGGLAVALLLLTEATERFGVNESTQKETRSRKKSDIFKQFASFAYSGRAAAARAREKLKATAKELNDRDFFEDSRKGSSRKRGKVVAMKSPAGKRRSARVQSGQELRRTRRRL